MTKSTILPGDMPAPEVAARLALAEGADRAARQPVAGRRVRNSDVSPEEMAERMTANLEPRTKAPWR